MNLQRMLKKPSRRQFLQWLGVGGLAAVTGCRPGVDTLAAVSDTPAPSVTHLPATDTATRTRTHTPVPFTPTNIPRAKVALGSLKNYDERALQAQVQKMFEQLDGLDSLIKPGARVGLKPNLTGGPWWDTPDRPPATEMFATHPAVVGALGRWAKDAGAGRLYIMDGIADETAWAQWGYAEMAKPLGAKLINLSDPAPYSDFASFPVGPQAQVYHQFYLNGLLRELDVFISVAKLKCHSVMGVTLALKNLIGLTPLNSYKKLADDNARTSLHGPDGVYDTRLPRVILELNLARPVDLAVIDGVITCEAGAGPWDSTMAQVKPGILVAGMDPVAADAVSTALMGFDPQADSKTPPFIHTDNYLSLAREAGLGTNRLEEIAVAGGAIADMRYPFKLP